MGSWPLRAEATGRVSGHRGVVPQGIKVTLLRPSSLQEGKLLQVGVRSLWLSAFRHDLPPCIHASDTGNAALTRAKPMPVPYF